MQLEVYIDESGWPAFDKSKLKHSTKWKERLFVIAALVTDAKARERLVQGYKSILDIELTAPGGTFRLRDIFRVYNLMTGKKPELKAGHLVNQDGAFLLLRWLPRNLLEDTVVTIFEAVLNLSTRYSLSVYIVVVDKLKVAEKSERIEKRSGLPVDLRVLALDFLLTRLLRKYNNEILIVHDEVQNPQFIRDCLAEAARRGYIYNPRFKLSPDDYARVDLMFTRSEEEPLIQLADVVAYAARSLKSGTISQRESHVYRKYLRVSEHGKVIWIEYL